MEFTLSIPSKKLSKVTSHDVLSLLQITGLAIASAIAPQKINAKPKISIFLFLDGQKSKPRLLLGL